MKICADKTYILYFFSGDKLLINKTDYFSTNITFRDILLKQINPKPPLQVKHKPLA